jgi:hypothetical protein
MQARRTSVVLAIGVLLLPLGIARPTTAHEGDPA